MEEAVPGIQGGWKLSGHGANFRRAEGRSGGDWAVILQVRLTVPKTRCFGRQVSCHQESPQDQSRGLPGEGTWSRWSL